MRTITFLLALTMLAGNAFADISLPEVQQALHQIMPPGEYASDHVFVCERRMIYRCDDDDNIVVLNQYVDEASQLQADFSVFTHLETYNLIADLIQVDQLPEGLAALNNLKKVNIAATKLPLIEGQFFPVNLPSLILQTVAGHDISLQGFENHQLDSLEVYASAASVDFKNSSLPNLSRLDLGNSLAVKNVDFSTFTNVTSFSWLYLYNHDVAAYHTARIQFPNLQDEVVELDFSRKHSEEPLTEIPSYVFDIPNLYSLRFAGHDLTEVPEQLFAMPSLKILSLTSNKIDAIGAIDTDSNLEVLLLNSNALAAVPAELFQLKNLRELNLSSNKLASLPEDFGLTNGDSTLEKLVLRGNQLTQLPAGMSQLGQLHDLNVASNKIDALHANLFQLNQLRELDVSHNKISTLPAGLLAMQNLENLNARSNSISAIEIADTASTLQGLELGSNQLKQVPAKLFQLESLQSLSLWDNKIAILPTIEASNASLKALSLQNNELSSLPVGLFNHLPLQNLSARNNKLTSLPEGISNDSLTFIDFEANEFSQVPDELLNFTALRKASFTKNKIEDFGEQWKQSASLEELQLGFNQLKTLTADMLNNLPASLTQLTLAQNELVGELPSFAPTNPELYVSVADNRLWSSNKNTMRLYGKDDGYGKESVLQRQHLPVRGIKVTEKQVDGRLISYIQWGFPLMEDVTGERTRGIGDSITPSALENKLLIGKGNKGVNTGPNISIGYHLEIEYTQGDNAGKKVKRAFTCSPLFVFYVGTCDFKYYSASFNSSNYASSVATYGVEGSLAGAKITVTRNGSVPTYWGVAQEHEQFVDELDYEGAVLPPVDLKPFLEQTGSAHYYHWLILLAIVLIRGRRMLPFAK